MRVRVAVLGRGRRAGRRARVQRHGGRRGRGGRGRGQGAARPVPALALLLALLLLQELLEKQRLLLVYVLTVKVSLLTTPGQAVADTVSLVTGRDASFLGFLVFAPSVTFCESSSVRTMRHSLLISMHT